MNKLLVNSFIAMLSVLFTVLVLEFFLYEQFKAQFQLARDDSETPLFSIIENELPYYTLKPGAKTDKVTINSLGFRGKEPVKGKKSIFFLGDSLVFGSGLSENQTIPAKLQEHFPEQQVLNLGVPGYNTEQEALFLEKILEYESLVPELILLGYCLNDRHGSLIMRKKGDIREYFAVNYPKNPLIFSISPGTDLWLYRHSSLYRLLNSAFSEQASQELDPDLYAQSAAFEKIRKQAVKREIPLRVVIFPMLENRKNYEHRKEHERVQEVLKKLGINFTDLSEELLTHDDITLDGVHFNEKGSEIVADLISSQKYP